MAIRITPTTRAILNALADGRTWGYRICQLTQLESGIVYRTLRRLSVYGLVTSSEETIPHPGRPPRRYYDLTDAGRRRLAEITPDAPEPGA